MTVPILPPQIIVFDTENAQEVITAFSAAGYACLFDGIHGQDYQWFKKEILNEHLFYFMPIDWEDDLITRTVEDVVNIANPPDFVIVYGEGQELGVGSWDRITKFVEQLFERDAGLEIRFNLIQEIFPAHEKETIVWGGAQEGTKFDPATVSSAFGDIVTDGLVTASVPPDEIVVSSEYKYETLYIEKRDTMIYQINRPETVKPFTVVTTPFKLKGHEPFFTALFASNDWAANRLDVCKYDIPFLEQVWKHLSMPGKFDIDKMLKEATEACYPSSITPPVAEPVVYRHDIETVVRILVKRDQGSLEPVEESGTLDNLKKRRKLQ